MTTSIQAVDGRVTITMAGQLNTATSIEASNNIFGELDKMGDITEVTCNCSDLEYISSSGLRILLSLAKRYPKFSVTEVKPAVYEILETTGFTKIMTVERAMRRLDIEGCRLIGVGGVGKVYRLDGDTIIKVFRQASTMDEVRREIVLSKEAFVLGMPTAISFDVVKVAPVSECPEERYGLVYELLKAQTLSTYVKNHPDELDSCARQYAELMRGMHSVEVPQTSRVPSALSREKEQLEHIRRHLSNESVDMLLRIVDSIPEERRLLHLDLQTKNVMVQEGELMLIDMGEVAYGHPMLDLGHAYSAMVSFVGDYERTIGISRELGRSLWEKAMGYYFEGLPESEVERRKAMYQAVSCVRNFTWMALSDSFPPEVIEECKGLFHERVSSQYHFIAETCRMLGEWKV